MKKIIKLTFLNLILILYASQVTSLLAQATSLPLMQISDLEYQGAFAIPAADFGASSANYATSTIAYNSSNSSLFLSGFAPSGVLAEFSIPSLVNSTNLSALNEATILQNFRAILNQTPDGNPQGIDRITGMTLINGKLIVNGEEFYDAPADNTHTTLALENPSNIAGSTINGYYALNGAAHAAGWISPIPSEWQSLLGGSYIAGNSSKYSINGRLPMGISAFAFNPSNINGTPSGTIPTTTLLDFDLNNPLYAAYNAYEDGNYNVVQSNGNTPTGHTAASAAIVPGSNDLWTEESQASYGFIVPGTRTYLTIGSSGGHVSGIGYKATQSNGYECGGPCPYDANDYYNYYWLWDVNDLLAVKNGTLNAYDVRPYARGVFNAPFQTDAYTQTPEFHQILGGSYDASSDILYLAIDDGASIGPYDRVPVIAAYSVTGGSSCPPAGTACDDGNPNTENDVADGSCGCSGTNCPAAGTPCDDGNSNTENDVTDGSCGCSGTPISGACELLANSTFDNNVNNWVYWGCAAESVNGIVNLTDIIPGVNPWDVAFSYSQQNLIVEQGETYTFTFRARADANRTLNLYIGMLTDPYTTYHYETVNLSSAWQEFTVSFTMNSATDNNTNFDFNLGGDATNTYIDYASLQKVNCGSCPAAGTPCDDNNPNTVNDVQDGFCNCSGTMPPQPVSCECPAISENGTIITVQNVSELQNALDQAYNANGNMTIKLQPGVYTLSSNLRFISENMSNLTIMGATGNRDDVVLKGLGWNNSTVTHIFNVAADGFTIANMTIGEVYYHLIQIQSNPADADNFKAQNVRFVDAKEQLLKVSAGGNLFADNGSVLCCEFEFTAGIAYQNYTGGIDAHRSKNWVVKNNVFKGIRSPDNVLAEHAIHFWRECEGTVVSGNHIINCDRGIGFGLGSDVASGHVGGLIMNNFVHTNRDVGIGLESATNVKVYNNTVVTDNYPRSIEYRFPTTTNAQIANNLVSGEITDRSSGSTGTKTTNYTFTNTNIFADAANYDYHLVNTPSGIVDAGTILSEVSTDFDCDARISGSGMDIGADEVGGSTAPEITLNISVWLEGSYNASSNTMGNTLENLSLLPNQQPYGQAPWSYNGSETLSGTGCVDWVIVSFRTNTSKESQVGQIAGLVQQDGSIDFQGESGLPNGFNTPVYIMIEHRNHFPAMTPQLVNVVGNTLSYDFRTADSYASGSSYGQKQMPNGDWCLFTGDINQLDPNGYDINGSDKSAWATDNGLFSDYFPSDLNMDGDVNGADKSLWNGNNGVFSSVPK